MALAALAALPVEAKAQNLSRVFNLQFDFAGAPLESVRVLAGGTTEITLTLDNSELLSVVESVEITLSTRTVSVSEASLTLTRASPSASLTIGATYDAASPDGRVTVASSRVVVNGARVSNARVADVSPLAVAIVARRFRVELELIRRFVYRAVYPTTGTLVADSRLAPLEARLPPPRFTRGTVVPSLDREPDPGFRIPDATYSQATSATITVPFLLNTNVRMDVLAWITHPDPRDLRVSLINPNGGVVFLHNRRARLGESRPPANDPSRGFSPDGRGIDGFDFLSGSLRGDWTLTVGDYVSGNTGVLNAWELVFMAGDEVADGSGPLRLRAGDTLAVMARLISVPGKLGMPVLVEGESPEVDFVYSGSGVTLLPARFVAGKTTVTTMLQAVPEATTGTFEVSFASPLPNARIEPVVSKPVEILPREFALDFSVLAERRVSLGVPIPIPDNNLLPPATGSLGIPVDGRVESVSLFVSISHPRRSDVGFSLVKSGAGGRVVRVLGAGSLPGTSDIRQTYDKVNVPELERFVNRPAPGDWNLVVHDGQEGLTGTLDEWRLALEVGSLAWVSVPTEGRASVRLRLSSDLARLAPGESLSVDLAYAGGTGVTVQPERLTLTAASPMAEVVLSAGPLAVPGRLTATPGGTSLPNTTAISPVEVPVRILPRERRFALMFRTLEGESLTVRQVSVDRTTQVRLILSGAAPLGEDEALTVDFAYAPEDGVVAISSPSQVRFAGGSTVVVVTLSATTDARAGRLTASVSYAVNAVIAPASLQVEIFPQAGILPREFALVFTTLTGKPLERARVRAGGMTQVRLTLSGAASLGADETLTVDFAYAPLDGGVAVSSPRAVFTEGSTQVDLTLSAVVRAQAGMLTAVPGVTLPNTLPIASADLPVAIAPRRFDMSFPRGSYRLLIKRSTISDIESVEVGVFLNQVKLEAGETVTVNFTVFSRNSPMPGLAVEPATVEFSDTQRSTVINLVVDRKDAETDFFTVSARFEEEGHPNAEFNTATLWVRVEVERIFSFVFEPKTLLITSGERASARLSFIEHIAPLRSYERVKVRLTASGAEGVQIVPEGVRIVPEVITFSGRDAEATESMIEFIVDDEAPAQRFTLDVTVLPIPTSYVLDRVSYISSALSVAVMPRERKFNLVLNWRSPTVELLPSERNLLPIALVSVGDALLRPGERVAVDLSIGGEGVSIVPARIVFDSDTKRTMMNVYFKNFMLIADTFVPTSQSLSMTGSISDDDSVLPDEVTVSVQSPLFVVVTRILFRYEYRLDFEPSMLTAALDAGELTASRTINSRLRAKLFSTVGSSPEFLLSEGFYLGFHMRDAVRFSLSVEGEGVTVSEPTLWFRRFERVKPVELQIDVSRLDRRRTSVFLSTLTAIPVAPMAPNVAMDGQSLPMKVILSPPGAFTSPGGDFLDEARVLAGSSTLVQLVLRDSTLLRAGDIVQMVFDSPGISVFPSLPNLVAPNLSRTLMLSAPYDADPDNSVVAVRAIRLFRLGTSRKELGWVRLPMRIVERRFALEFEPSTLTVAGGSTASVSLSLQGIEDPSGLGAPRLGEGETPSVAFSYDQTGVIAAGQGFAFGSTRINALLTVDSDATSGTLVAFVPALVNATAEMAALFIEVGASASSASMLARRFALEFGPDSLALAADDTVSVPLSLRGIDGSGAPGLDVGEVVPVGLSYTGEGLTVPFNLVFTVDDMQVDVSVSAALDVTPGILSAFVPDLPNATVEMATLPVNVLLSPVSYGSLSLAFASSPSGLLQSLQVLTGVSTRVRLVLPPPGRLSTGETVLVTLGASAALAVEPSTFTLTSAVPEGVFSVVTAAHESATTGRIFVASARLVAEGGAPVTLAPASLTVSILPFEAPEMVEVPAGNFQMGGTRDAGNSDELPAHGVAVARFAVSKYEITRAQYAAFVAATGHDAGSCWNDPGFTQTRDHPVVCVSWSDARAYVIWLSERTGRQYGLLSEAEWEYAARAGTLTRYPFGNDAASLQGRVTNCNENFCGDGHERTSPVGSFGANGFGLYDMSGNAREWVEDCYHASYTAVPTDGSAWTSACGFNDRARVIRGGSWSDGTEELRSSHRAWSDLDERSATHGFRVRAVIPY